MRLKSRTGASFDELCDFLEPVLDYSATMWTAVLGLGGSSTRYTDRLLKDRPARYYSFGQLLVLINPDGGFNYIQRAIDKNIDPPTGAFLAPNLIYYYLGKNMTNKAEQVSNWAGKVSAEPGIRARVRFLRAVGRVEEAMDACRSFEDRYGDSRPFVAACNHYRYKTRDHRYDSAVQKRLTDLFPEGIEHVGLTNFTQRPLEGVVVSNEDEFTREAGLKRGDVVVAVCGVRVHDWFQYDYARYLEEKPETTLIVWDGNRYVARNGRAAAESVIGAYTYNLTGAPVSAASRKH